MKGHTMNCPYEIIVKFNKSGDIEVKFSDISDVSFGQIARVLGYATGEIIENMTDDEQLKTAMRAEFLDSFVFSSETDSEEE